MSKLPRLIVELSFVGGRFADHGIDVTVLNEVIQYKTIVTEVAKDVWRSRNPDRERLPNHFEEAFSLKIYRIVPNCVTIPLEREAAVDSQQALFDFEPTDELTMAVEMVANAIHAASTDQPLPSNFPKRVLPLFQQYGTSLLPGERIEQRPFGWERSVIFDERVRTNISRVVDSNYNASVDVVGNVTMARVNRPKVAIQVDGGREIEAVFLPEHEEAIVTALKDHDIAKIRVAGIGQYSGAGELIRLIEVHRVELLPKGEMTFDSSSVPIWLQFQKIASSLPAHAFDVVPQDGASRHDYYLYRNVTSQ